MKTEKGTGGGEGQLEQAELAGMTPEKIKLMRQKTKAYFEACEAHSETTKDLTKKRQEVRDAMVDGEIPFYVAGGKRFSVNLPTEPELVIETIAKPKKAKKGAEAEE